MSSGQKFLTLANLKEGLKLTLILCFCVQLRLLIVLGGLRSKSLRRRSSVTVGMNVCMCVPMCVCVRCPHVLLSAY